MANFNVFNPYIPEQEPPDFTGRSRGAKSQETAAILYPKHEQEVFGAQKTFERKASTYVRPVITDRSTGILLEGAGQVLGAGITLADRLYKAHIETEVQNQISGVRAQFGVSSADAIATGVDSDNPPSDLVKQVDKLNDLNQAYQNGTLKESNYRAMVLTTERSLKNRFPLYSDYVSKVVQNVTGSIPEEALRRALQSEALANAPQTDAERLQKLEDKMINDGSIPSDYFVRQGTNPYTLTELQKEQARVQSKEFSTTSRQRQIELNKSIDAENKQFNADTANQEVWNKVETATRPMLTSIQQATQSIYGGLAQGQEPTPQEQQQIVASFGQFKSSVLAQFDLTMKEPHGESGWTYNQSLAPEDRTKLENGIKNYLEVQEDALTHNRTGILDATKTHLEAIQTGDQTKILESDDFARLLSANSKLFGPEVNNQLMLQTKGAGLDAAAAFVNKELTLKLSNQGVNAPLSEHFRSEIEKGNTDPKGYWSAISDRYNQITDPKLPTNVRYNQVMGMFGTDPFQYFIDKGDDTLASQRTLYTRFSSPEFATQVKAIAADGHPDALQTYSKWIYEKAALLNRTAIQDAKDITTSRPNMRLSFDTESHQLVVDEGVSNINPATGTSVYISGFSELLERTLMEPAARRSVDQINQAIRGLVPVIEAQGIKDVNKELFGFFASQGLDLTQEDVGYHENAIMSMYDSIREAFRRAAKAYTKGASGG